MIRNAVLSVEWRLLPTHLASVVRELQAEDVSLIVFLSFLTSLLSKWLMS